MNKHIANIGYVRENGDDGDRWKRIGRLFYDQEKHSATILLHGWRQGICIAKPFSLPCPFFRGEILFKIGDREVDGKPEIDYLFVGFVATNVPDSFDADPHYAVKLDSMPITGKLISPAGIWLDVKLDDGPGWRKHE